MQTTLLILDLDDTIFETKSMNSDLFEMPIGIINNYYKENVSVQKSIEVLEDLWKNPIDVVFQKYNTPVHISQAFFNALNAVEYKLDIKTFSDYSYLQALKFRKILVTTGLRKLQYAKMKALGIMADFEKIYVDDPQEKDRVFKLGIFEEIVSTFDLDANNIWAIGDNPDSEIKAAHQLGMRTIQRKVPSRRRSEVADYIIDSFSELPQILN